MRQSSGLGAWRSALATSVASAALLAYGVRPVRAAPPLNCTANGATVTCTGDQSAGIQLNNGGGPYTILNVNNLTTNITPASTVTGVEFNSNNAVALTVDPGPFAIITTDANGIFASSNGGTVTINSTADVVTSGGSATGIQGSGQNDLVSINSSGNITTSGNNAFGIAAGSVYGDVTVVSSGNITTSGTFAAGINVGSIGQPGTTDGAITIRSTGNITTIGTDAIGINAATVYGPVDITSAGNIAVSGTASIGINAQTVGDVKITSTGNITAGTDSSAAILALSQSNSVLITSTGDIATAGQTGIGIYARAGQTATVLASGSITTLGDNAPGIAASGYTGTNVVTSATIRTFGTDAHGITAYGAGDVTVTSSGSIATAGPTSDGINVVSSNGAASVVNSGDVSATGTGSAGIYAAGYTSARVVNFGTVVGGPCCAGVMERSTGSTTLMNFGTIVSGPTDFAIDSIGFNNTVQNFGTVTGDVILTATGGTNVFINQQGALFNSGTTADVGTLTNAGTISPGGSGAIVTTNLDDNMAQTGTGTLAIDIDAAAATSDLVIVSNTADLAGTVSVNILTLPPPTAQVFTILQALSGVTNSGLALSASPALHAALTFTPTEVLLSSAVDFSTSALNGNQLVLSQNLDAAFHAGGGGLTPVLLGLLNTEGLDAYKAALNELTPELYSDAQMAALFSSLGFSNSLLSCKVNGADTAAIIREGQCLWAGASAVFLDTGTTSSQIGFNQSIGQFAAGAQVALDPVWRLGFAAGYQSSSIDTATNASTDGELAQGGVALKYNPGALLLAATATGGHGWYETQRPMAFGGFAATPRSSSDLDLFSIGGRAAYVFGTPQLYFKPMIDAAATRLDLGGFSELGGGAADLVVQGSGQTVLSAMPVLEAGTEFWLGNGTLLRPYLRGGVALYGNSDLALTANFLAAPAGVAPFTIETKMDDAMGIVGAGIDVINNGDAVLHFAYDGQLGETTQIHAFVLKGSARF